MRDSIINKIFKQKKLENVFFIIGVILILLLWLISSNLIDNEIVIPKINDVARRTYEYLTDWYTIKIVLFTIVKLIVIVTICAILAYLLAVLAYLSNSFRYILKPFMSLIRTLPIVTVIILLLLYVGFKATPIYICAFVVLPIIYEQVLVSFDGIDKNIIEETKMLSNTNFKVIVNVYLPLSMPYFISSIFTVLGLGLKVLVMAEIFSLGNNTIGEQIQIARSLADTVGIFAWTLILLIIVFIFESVIRIIMKKRAI